MGQRGANIGRAHTGQIAWQEFAARIHETKINVFQWEARFSVASSTKLPSIAGNYGERACRKVSLLPPALPPPHV